MDFGGCGYGIFKCTDTEYSLDEQGNKYKHSSKEKDEETMIPTHKKQILTKRDIQCRYYKNCREGKNCLYWHPDGKINKNLSKNGEVEMQDTLHFLMNEIKELREDMKKIKVGKQV